MNSINNVAVEDKIDSEAFNRVVWTETKGDRVSYPTERSHVNLHQNRAQLLEESRLSENRLAVATSE